jgi:hypothetical protein
VKLPDISYCWDGVTSKAELRIDGATMRGDPHEVQEAFDKLCALRNRCFSAESKLRMLYDQIKLL